MLSYIRSCPFQSVGAKFYCIFGFGLNSFLAAFVSSHRRRFQTQNLEQLNHVGENEKRYDSDLTIVLNTIEDLRSEKEKLNEFPEGCVQAQKLQETIRRKKRELALLTDGTR